MQRFGGVFWGLGVKQTKFNLQLHHFLTVPPWVCQVPSLGLSLLPCTMGPLRFLPHSVVWEH